MTGAPLTGQALVASDEARSGLHLSGFDPSRIPWTQGTSDEAYGVRVWVSRIENLHTHFRIIKNHLPDDTEMGQWLLGQVNAGLAEAEHYIADCCPEAGLALAQTQSTEAGQ